MKINTILKKTSLPLVEHNHNVSKITIQSETCTKNSVFVAIHPEYIDHAISMGARTVICEVCANQQKNVNYVLVQNIRKYLAEVVKIYYKDISRHLKLIGVVGTNGKTTTATLGYSFFNSLNKSSMLIGSNGIFYEGYEGTTSNTTPDILTIYQHLLIARKKHIRYIFMEISSIAVDQYRTYGLDFDCLIFTNFSQDHLDYHKTMEEYLHCKTIPFIKLKRRAYALLNMDDSAYSKIAKYTDAKVLTYGFKNPSMFLGTVNTVNENGISFYAKGILFKSKLIGEFNLYNLLSIFPLCDIFHIPYLQYQNFLAHFSPVNGRMNMIHFQNKHIIIDYAHTFFATKQVIEEGLKLCHGNLSIVIGCGGNREKEKRAMIGNLLNEIPARIILTTDNPRYEDPLDIINDIQSTIEKDVFVIPDRTKAIQFALDGLQNEDYLLVLGKGCEAYIDIQGVKYPYSDLEVIHDWIRTH